MTHICVGIDISSELSPGNPTTRRRELLQMASDVLEDLESKFCTDCGKCAAQEEGEIVKSEKGCISSRFMVFINNELEIIDQEGNPVA